MSQEDRVERLMRLGSRLWIAKYRLRRVRNSPASRAIAVAGRFESVGFPKGWR